MISQFPLRSFWGGRIPRLQRLIAKGDYIVLTESRIDTVPESIVIDRNGREILSLETCDISDLPDDWNWPIP